MKLLLFYLTGLLASLQICAQPATLPGAVVINEILFNPKSGGSDYIEIYNRTDSIINLKGWQIANRNAAGAVGSIKIFPSLAGVIMPGAYRVLTEEPVIIRQHYQVRDTATFIPFSTLPSYPDARGAVVLLDSGNTIADEVSYLETWHFALLNNNEGVALERIGFNQPSQDAGNWHSAAADAGYGTPGYRNSQQGSAGTPTGSITIEPKLFSPDNDGYNDYAIISYNFPEGGYVCNITVFNILGIPIKLLVRSAVCGPTGFFKWDGSGEQGKSLPAGAYIVFTEVFDLHGKTKRFKQVLVLARKH
ncbi:MAG: lamin tail domain-containing protein [Chitinophagaceae bacterium]|nr:lamin tail domain-containing protein [Chitinophagaceae bacterium]